MFLGAELFGFPWFSYMSFHLEVTGIGFLTLHVQKVEHLNRDEDW
jgi:hypothetical protein